jgi:hypothetical protein
VRTVRLTERTKFSRVRATSAVVYLDRGEFSPTAAPVQLADTRVRWTERVLPPFAAFVVVRALLAAVAYLSGYKPWLAKTYARGDSAHYLSIAKQGYEFFSCARMPGYNPNDWCGNTAWLPGYPALIKAVSLAGISPEQSGVLISAAASLAGLTLLWNGFLGPARNARSWLTLALAALFPGHVYYAAVFPIALCTFLSLLAIKLFDEERFALAGLVGCVSAFTYSTGFFLAFAFGLNLLLWHWREGLARLSTKVLLSAGLTVTGFVAALLVQRMQVGVWNAYQLVQAKYHYAFTPPWVPLVEQARMALSPKHPIERQAMLVLLLVVTSVWAALRAPRRPLDSLLAIYALCYWLVPLMLGPGYVAVVRAESMLLPMVPLARKLPVAVLVVLVLCALLLAPVIGSFFFYTKML